MTILRINWRARIFFIFFCRVVALLCGRSRGGRRRRCVSALKEGCEQSKWLYFRLQNSPYFCVFKFARTVKQKVWSEAEN